MKEEDALELTNLDKVLWPQTGFTKGDMIAYYRDVSPALLPHLRDRPLTLRRSPNGIEGPYWFQHDCPAPPAWMATHPVPSVTREGVVYRTCLANDLRSLLWVANLAAIELHPLLWRRIRAEEPCYVVFDLDPAPPADLAAACGAALLLRRLLRGHGLEAFPKTSGATGIHVFVPLAGGHDFDQVGMFATSVAEELAQRHPRLLSATRQAGRVNIDWAQNRGSRSMVAAYSLRATSIPSVSVPITWDEMEEKGSTAERDLRFSPRQVLERLDHLGDPFRPVLELEQRLPTRAGWAQRSA